MPITTYLDIAVTKVTEQFAQSHNIDFESCQFRQAQRDLKKSFEEFHTRLRKLSQICEFDNADKKIKRQIISECLSL